jgi:ELWxxDGT repeat protein
MTVTAGVLFFATDPAHGQEPRVTDGIFATNLVENINRARDE